MNEPIGLLGSFNPTRFRWIALVTFIMASSCPMIISFISAAILTSLPLSLWATFMTGMPVIIDTTSAISFSSTGFLLVLLSSSHCSFASSSFFWSLVSWSLSSAASSYCWFFTDWFLATLTFPIALSSSSICSGTCMFLRWVRAPTSSITSIALSGRNRSLIYLVLKLTHASIASSE